MTLSAAIAAALASFLHVGLRSAQSINVVTGARLGPRAGRPYYLAVCPVAFGISIAEIFIVSAIVVTGWPLVPPLALGATAGCCVSMFVHHRLRGGAL